MPSESPLNDRRAKLKTKTELVTVKKCKVRQRPRALSIQYPVSTIQCPVSPDWIGGCFRAAVSWRLCVYRTLANWLDCHWFSLNWRRCLFGKQLPWWGGKNNIACLHGRFSHFFFVPAIIHLGQIPLTFA